MEKNMLVEHEMIRKKLSGIKHKIVVMSGKGGVGKSSISAMLAMGLSKMDQKCAILDVDLHGPSIPVMLGFDGQRSTGNSEEFHLQKYSDKLSYLSIGTLLSNQNDSIAWRGPRKHAVIRQLLKDTNWGELDYLIIDTPPGTGDEQMTIIQSITNLDGAVIVTTPQEVSLSDVRKSIDFCRQMKVPILGIVENMSGFVCPHCNHQTEVFKKRGGELLSASEQLVFLGAIPLDPLLMNALDQGKVEQTLKFECITNITKNVFEICLSREEK